MAEPYTDIPALILAGGFGTRIRPLLGEHPKVLAPIHGRPFLHYLLAPLVRAGVRRTVVCTGYQADLVERTLGGTFGPMKLIYSRETTPLGTGGALRAALSLVDFPLMLALNGDSYCRLDFADFLDWHRAHGAVLSLTLAQVPDAGRFGQARTDEEGRIVEFAEKRRGGGPGWVNAGVYLLERRVLEGLPPGQAVSLEHDMFPASVGRGLFGYPGGHDFLDIGTPESYAAAEALVPDCVY